MNKYVYWGARLPLLFGVGMIARILSPIACMFIETKFREDTVKRLGKIKVTLPRDSLVWWLSWFDTDDNATDEYWYGMYPYSKYFTQEQYDNSVILRWFMRMCWLQRNSAYTFNRRHFGLEKDSPYVWQYKAIKYIGFGWNNDINIGWKAHKGFDTLMLAGRVIGLRKKEN